MSEIVSPMPPMAGLVYVVGIDIGMESCMMCCLTMEKRQVIKPSVSAGIKFPTCAGKSKILNAIRAMWLS